MAEETMRAFDLTKVDDSDIMTQPFSLSDTDPIISEKKSNVMTGDEFSKLGKISSSWNDPAWKKTSASEVFGTEKVDLTKPEEFIASTSQGFIDEIANFPDKIKNETAQIVMEGYQDKNKLTQRLIGYISNVLPKLPVGTQPDELVKKIVDKSDVFKPEYDEKLVNTLDGREYPLVEWARKTLSNTTKAIQDRDLARVLQAEQRGIDRDAWSNQLGTTIGAMMPVIALGKGVGGISKALGATAETASKVGATAMKAGTLAQMTGDYAYTTAAQYLDKTGDSDFTNFTPEDAKGLSALGYGAIGTMIEYGFGGVEPLFASGMEKLGTSNILKAVGKTMAGEAWEEFLQEWEEFLFRNADGTNTRTWGETLKDSLKSAVYGGLIGGVVGDVAYRTNRRNIANALMKTGMDYGTAIKIADTVIEDTGQEIFKRADENLSLTNKVGESFSKLQGNIKVALETAGWSDNIINPTTQQPMDIDTYSNIMAADISSQIVRQASLSGLSPNEFMDVSQFQAIDNVVYLKPLGTKADIKSQIDAQDFIIKRQRELKKTGAEDNDKLKLAQMRKNILKKAYDIKEYQGKRAKERIKAQTTPETAQEIEKATKDVESVKGVTQAEFDSKVDTENLTSAEKSKRYGNAVIKSILPTKTDFDAVMVDPMYANAKQAIIAVADRINSFIKAHRTYGLKTDIANALKKMQTVNQGNFIDSVTTPDLDGVDVVAENAFLYHFLFSDATTIQTYLDSYITRAEESLNRKNKKLSKKDLVGQAFKATDNAMQTQAQVIGAEYTSIYNEDGSYADKNVMAVMLSYQNQFVQEQGQQIPPQMLEQFDLANENARLDDIYPAYDGETIEVDGKERTVYNSNGDRIAKSKEALTNFWRWFGDSKVVDKKGRPIVMHHGSKASFDEFYRSSDIGFHFGSKGAARIKAGRSKQAVVYNVYLKIQNPLKFDRDLGNWDAAKDGYLAPALLNMGIITKEQFDALRYSGGAAYSSANAKLLRDALQKRGYDGIEYPNYYEDTGKISYVALEPTQIKSVDNRGTYSADTGNILYQSYLENKLVATHGITIDKLNKALALGGLPVPSIGISKATEPLKDFGDIKLVGTKDIIDPESDPANKVYDRDIWSSTFPMPEYKNATIKQARAFREKFGKYFSKTDSYANLNDLLYYATDSKRPYQAIGKFLYSDGAQVYYIENVLGEKFDIPMENRNLIRLENSMPFVKPDEQFIEEVSQIDNNVDNSDVLRKALDKPLHDLIARSPASEAEKQHARNYFFGENKEGLFNFSNHSVFNLVSAVKEYKANKDVMSVNNLGLMHALANYNLINDSKYVAWAEKEMANLLGEPMVKVGNRKLPWTKENIAKAMMRGPIVGSEGGMETSIGKVIASGAKQFGSIEEIRQAGQQLNTMDTANQITDTLGARISQFAQNIINQGYGEYDRTNIMDALVKVVSKPNPTKEALLTALRQKLEDSKATFDDALLEEGVQVAKDVRNVSRYYFEAKLQRVVGFNEFAGAVVPLDPVYDESAAQLQALGLDVVRTNSVEVGIDQIAARNRDVLFQSKKANGFYDPELGVIVLGRNMNEMTLPHEMQHYWLDKIFSIYKRAKSGELKVRDEWMTETKALFDMLGIDENQTQLTQGQQEKFARMSEAYLTGIGVTGDMNATFKEYQQWVPEKYKSILNLGYLSDDGKVEYPFLDQGAVDFFNKWYANYSLPSLPTSPERQEFINPEDENGEVLPVSIKEMNNRDKEFGNDAEEQVKTDQRLYNTLDENMPAEIKVEADGQKVVQASRGNFLKESEKQQRRWFERKSRDTEAQLAQDYIEKNPEHAKEVIFGDPELIPNDTGIDRATLINAYMALNNITPESEDWATLHTNIAINQSLAGTQLALSNNTSYRTYLDALREIENAREMKAATNYAGAKQGAVERFNRDIQRFVDEELPKVLATAPNTEARDIALKSLFERARTKFSGNTTGGVLNQMDFDYARGQKGASAAFTRWAVNQIKKDAGAKLNGQEQAQLLNLSAKAQQAVIDLDDRDTGKAVAGAQEIRKWQVEKDKLMGVKPQKFSLFGDYAPRAMLASFNTLVVSNIPSTAMNTAVVRMLESGIFGKNEVSKSLTDSEIKRIKAIYGATAMNLAQMEKPTSPSLLHGEKYSSSGQKWYDPFTILGKEDNWFRVPTFVNTLARIATQDAKATGKSADEVFKEYCRLENQSDAAKLARKQALAVSNMAVFTQDGTLARSLNGIRDWINQGSRALIGLDPKGFGLGNLLSPFLKTGANIAEMGIRGSLAPITTISALAQKWRSGKAIDPMKKLALAMDWSYFALSSVTVALLAALTSDDDEFYTEPYEMGKKYDPDKPYDSINIAGVWIDLDFFGPFAIPIRTGCRLVKQWKTDNLSAIYKGYGQGLKYAAMDTPLLQEIFNNQMSYAAKKPEDWATGLVYNQANKLVPSQVKPLSRAISRGSETQLDMDWSGKIIERKFHRNYGFDGAELTTQDLIDIFSTKFTWQP